MKKILSVALGLLTLATPAFGTVSPAYIKGEADTTKIEYTNIDMPNHQVTALSGLKTVRLETGNKNILTNPSAEGTAWSGWSGTLGTGIARTGVSTATDGVQALQVTFTAKPIAMTQDSTVNATAFADGTLNGTRYCDFKTSITSTPIYFCPRSAGAFPASASLSSVCQLVNADGKFRSYKIDYPLGGTSNGLGFTSDGVNVTGAVVVDNCKVEQREASFDLNVIGPWVSWTPTGTWSANTTYTGKYRQVGENVEFDVRVATSGAPTSTFLAINLPNSWTVDTNKMTTTSDGTRMYISDGVVIDSGSRVASTKALYFTSTSVYVMYHSSSNAIAVTQAAPITFGASDSVSVTFTVPITQLSGATTAYSSLNTDFGWRQYTPTLSSTTGVSGNSAFYMRKGDTLFVSGYVNWTGTGGGATFTVGLPSGLSIDTTKMASTTGLANKLGSARWFDSGTTTHPETVEYTTATTVNFRADDSTGALPQGTGFANGDYVTYEFKVPIVGWENSNVIVANIKEAITKPGIYKPVRYQADIDSADAVTNENTDWINGNCTNATTGAATCVPQANAFASGSIVRCWTRELATSAGNDSVHCRISSTETTSSIPVLCKQGTAGANYGFTLFCEGQLQ